MVCTICRHVFSRDDFQPNGILWGQREMHRRGNRARNLGLDVEDIRRCELPIVLLGPQVHVRARIDQLDVDSDLVADLLHAALEDGVCAELPTNLPDVHLAVSILGHRGAGYHPHRLELSQLRQEIVVHAVGKEMAVARKPVGYERQHRHHWRFDGHRAGRGRIAGHAQGAEQHRCKHHGQGAETPKPGLAQQRACRFRGLRRRGSLQRGREMADESTPHHRLDIRALVFGRQDLAQDRNAPVYRVIGHDSVVPDRGHDFIPADERVLVREKIIQQPGNARLQPNRFGPVEQVAGVGVEAPLAESAGIRPCEVAGIHGAIRAGAGASRLCKRASLISICIRRSGPILKNQQQISDKSAFDQAIWCAAHHTLPQCCRSQGQPASPAAERYVIPAAPGVNLRKIIRSEVREDMNRQLIFTTIALAAWALPPQAVEAGDKPFANIVPALTGAPPEGFAIGRAFTAYTGSVDGSIYKLNLRTGEGEILVPAEVEDFDVFTQCFKLGMRVDRRSNYLFAAGCAGGNAYVFDAETGEEIMEYQLTDPFTTVINDLAITRKAVFFTDFGQPFLYRLPLSRNGRLPEGEDAATPLPLIGDFKDDHDAQQGFSLANGIVLYGNMLFILTPYDVIFPDNGPPFADPNNPIDRIQVVALDEDQRTGTLLGNITDPENLDGVASGAMFGGSLYVNNARYLTFPGPDTEYWITRLDVMDVQP